MIYLWCAPWNQLFRAFALKLCSFDRTSVFVRSPFEFNRNSFSRIMNRSRQQRKYIIHSLITITALICENRVHAIYLFIILRFLQTRRRCVCVCVVCRRDSPSIIRFVRKQCISFLWRFLFSERVFHFFWFFLFSLLFRVLSSTRTLLLVCVASFNCL